MTELFNCLSTNTLQKPIMPCLSHCNYAPHVCLHHIFTSITLRTTIIPCFSLRTQKFQRKTTPRIRRVTRRTRASPAPRPPHTASHTTSFRNPVHADLLWKHKDSHTSLLLNLTLSQASDLFKCELALDMLCDGHNNFKEKLHRC